MSPTFVLIHGAGGSPWSWHLVDAELRRRGHDDVIAVTLPCDDDAAGLDEYVDAALAAIGDRREQLVVVGHSLGGFTSTLVCDRLPVELHLLVTAMVPAPGEAPGDWWVNTGFMEARAAEVERLGGDDSEETTFTHDVPPTLATEAGEQIRDQSGTPMEKPFPLAAMPAVPTRFLVCTGDRFFPPAFMRRVVRERLGIEPDEIDAGHLPMLSRPVELTAWIEACVTEAAPAPERPARR